MGALRGIFLVLTATTALSAYWLYEPIPPGFSTASALRLRTFLASMKIMQHAGLLLETFGYDSSLNITRSIQNFVSKKTNEKPLEGIMTHDEIFDGVHVRVYTPVAGDQEVTRAGFVFIHGGGWSIGSINMYHTYVGKLCNLSGAIFISVEYKLAPEHPFPAGFEDSLAATKYFLHHAAQYGVDPQRVAIGGDSAGGNLATAVALRLRDESFTPHLKLQVLIYPAVQLVDFTLPSMLSTDPRPILRATGGFKSMYVTGRRDMNEAFMSHSILPADVHLQLSATHLNVSLLPSKYQTPERPAVRQQEQAVPGLTDEELRVIRERMLNPYVSPLLADNLAGLPHTYMFTCEFDVLRDEGFLYARRLQESGVTVHHVNAMIGFHGIQSLHTVLPEADQIISDMISYITPVL